MRIWDCHSHCQGTEKGEDVLRAMDTAGVERINLFSHFPGKPTDPAGGHCTSTREQARAEIDHLASVQSADPSRIYGLIWADPRCKGIVEEVERGIVDKGLRGLKLIPDHWYPCDEMLHPLYRKMESLGKPIMFHSGIIYGFGDSSKYCQPVGYEFMLNFPKLRFSLAHISWPWVDECLAVYGRMNAAVGEDVNRTQMWVDTCRGTPENWREEAMRKAVPFMGMDHLMFGIDGSPSGLPTKGVQHIRRDETLLQEVMGLSQAQIEMFFFGACEKFMGT